MKRACLYTAAVMLLVFLGCEGFLYEIVMTPRGQEIDRKITVTRTGTTQPATKPAGGETPEQEASEEIQRMAKLYGVETPKGNTLSARFKGRTPDDVGGAGFYRHYRTRMGVAWIYSERFRGNADLARQVEARSQAVDTVVGHVIGWLGAELGRDPRFDKLHTFLDGPFRRDMKSLAMYLWLNGIAGRYESIPDGEMMMRAGQFLAERGYFSADDLPAITRAILGADEDGRRILALAQRLLARKMGVSGKDPVPASLRFLADAEAASESLEKYLRTTDEYKELLRQHKAELKKGDGQPDTAPAEPNAMDVLQEPIDTLLASQNFPRDNRVELKLVVPAEPVPTNGRWDANAGAVMWSKLIPQRDKEVQNFPAVCYALWAAPDEAFQKKHFGKVVFSGEALMNYCLWRNSLDAREAKQWDTIVSAMRPGHDISDKVHKLFPSSSQPAAAPGATTRYAEPVIEMIEEALKEDTEEGKKDGPGVHE